VLQQQVQQELVVVVAVVSSSLISTTTLDITHQIEECLMSGKGFGDELEQIVHISCTSMLLQQTWLLHITTEITAQLPATQVSSSCTMPKTWIYDYIHMTDHMA
jgi:hypothetical protein